MESACAEVRFVLEGEFDIGAVLLLLPLLLVLLSLASVFGPTIPCPVVDSSPEQTIPCSHWNFSMA